jgi:hypothetical protein
MYTYTFIDININTYTHVRTLHLCIDNFCSLLCLPYPLLVSLYSHQRNRSQHPRIIWASLVIEILDGLYMYIYV